SNLFIAQRVALLGHARYVLLRPGHHLDEQAFRAFSRHYHRSGVAALERRGLLVQTQASLLLLRTVALVACFFEERPNVLGEIHLARRGGWQFASLCRCAAA